MMTFPELVENLQSLDQQTREMVLGIVFAAITGLTITSLGFFSLMRARYTTYSERITKIKLVDLENTKYINDSDNDFRLKKTELDENYKHKYAQGVERVEKLVKRLEAMEKAAKKHSPADAVLVLMEILNKFEERLGRFERNPDVARNMDPATAMGVQGGRTVATRQCINDVEGALDDLSPLEALRTAVDPMKGVRLEDAMSNGIKQKES
jgi:hypothetical protein